jgi:hypothetical protein
MGHSEAILGRFLYPSKEDKSVEMWRYCTDMRLILVCLPEHATTVVGGASQKASGNERGS